MIGHKMETPVEVKDPDNEDGDYTEVKRKESNSKKDTEGDKDDGKKKSNEKIKDNEKKDKTCIHYIMRKCKHGRKGEDCEYGHPKLCFSFMNKGKKGCEKDDCEYHHPNMCKYDTECKNEKCRFLHP